MNFGRGHRILNFKKKPVEGKSSVDDAGATSNEGESEMKPKSPGFASDKSSINKEAGK